MKLISMTDFVLEQGVVLKHKYGIESVRKYAYFLKQPLKLEMFVPCDEDGNVLKPVFGKETEFFYADKYQQAKEKVLFKGFEAKKQGAAILVTFESNPVWGNWNNSKTIEDLLYLKPQLTPSAIKQLGL